MLHVPPFRRIPVVPSLRTSAALGAVLLCNGFSCTSDTSTATQGATTTPSVPTTPDGSGQETPLVPSSTDGSPSGTTSTSSSGSGGMTPASTPTPSAPPAGGGSGGSAAATGGNGAGGCSNASCEETVGGRGGQSAAGGGAGGALLVGGGGSSSLPVEPSGGADAGPPPVEGTLRVYLVDVEGGQATVIVFADGSVMLIDAGFPGDRDPTRIVDLLTTTVGTDRIDYLLTTHYDVDHVGGVPDVAALMEVGTFLDHGDNSAPETYLTTVMGAQRQIVVTGDQLDISGASLSFVSSARTLITEPLEGAGATTPGLRSRYHQAGR